MPPLCIRPIVSKSCEHQIISSYLQRFSSCSLGRKNVHLNQLCLHGRTLATRPISTLLSHDRMRFHHIWMIRMQKFATEKGESEKSRLIAERQEGGEVTMGKKVVQAGKDMTYLAVIVAGIGITAIMFFSVGQELFSSKSPNSVYSKALKVCKNNDEVIDTFGSPLKGYGEMTRRRRRRHVSHQEYQKDGINYMRMRFYIEGPSGMKGTVHLEVKEDENGKYQYRYLFVDAETYPRRTIIIEDNR